MTRKRFVKLLMARGIPRNEANGIANIVRIAEEMRKLRERHE